MKKLSRILFFALVLLAGSTAAQPQVRTFTHQDTLRGAITAERAWWDLNYYHLDIRVNPSDSTISGINAIRYKVTDSFQVIQVDLQAPMKITRVIEDNKPLEFSQDGNAWFVKLKKVQKPGTFNEIIVEYEGRPRVSRNPPWSGGLSWRKDRNGNPFVVTTCQGDGASIWWPCKDHQADEPDLFTFTTPVYA